MGTTNANKVAWADICLPKGEGGLGIPNIMESNKAYMARHIWNLARKKDSLWVKCCHTYRLRGQSLWAYRVQQDSSWAWNKIMKLRDCFYDCIKVKVGNGRDTYTWVDNWHDHGSLVKRYGTRLVYDAASNMRSKE